MAEKSWARFGMIGAIAVLTACGTTPDFDYEPTFQNREAETFNIEEPIPAPDIPPHVSAGPDTITFDREAMVAIQTAFEAASANAAIAKDYSDALTHLQDEIRALVAAGAAREAQIDQLRRAYRLAIWRERVAWGVAAGSLILVPFLK